MKLLFFLLFAAINKCCRNIKSQYFQFYNLQNLKWKGAKIGIHPTIKGKTAISITCGGSLQIGDNFICRSRFGGHILGGEYSSFNINSGG